MKILVTGGAGYIGSHTVTVMAMAMVTDTVMAMKRRMERNAATIAIINHHRHLKIRIKTCSTF